MHKNPFKNRTLRKRVTQLGADYESGERVFQRRNEVVLQVSISSVIRETQIKTTSRFSLPQSEWLRSREQRQQMQGCEEGELLITGSTDQCSHDRNQCGVPQYAKDRIIASPGYATPGHILHVVWRWWLIHLLCHLGEWKQFRHPLDDECIMKT